MASDKFTKMARTLPSLYKAETNTMVRALLKAWGISDDEIEVQLKETKDQIYVSGADNKYLDQLGSNVGVPRTPGLGIEDDDFRKLIPVLSYAPKQVRATIVALLDVFWGEGFTRANINSGNTETFNFGPATALAGTSIFRKDAKIVTGTGTQYTLDVQPGDYIKPASFDGTTYAKVSRVIDDTHLELSNEWAGGPAVNVSVVKGTIRELIYKVDNKEQTTIRFKPNAFSDLTTVTAQELADFINNDAEHRENVVASSFIDPILGNKLNIRTKTPGLQGSIQILGGDANDASRLNFDLAEITDTKVSIFEVNANEVVIKIPSSVPVLRRSLSGSAHPKGTKTNIYSSPGPYDFSSLGPASTLQIEVDGTDFNLVFTHATDFQDPTKVTALELAEVINAQVVGLDVFSKSASTARVIGLQTTEGAMEYKVLGGTANTILNFSTDLQQDPDLITEGYPSSYIFDPNGQLFTVTRISSELTDEIEQGSVRTTISLNDVSEFPNTTGQILINFGRSGQEGPIRYNSRPNNSTLLIDASHVFENNHAVGRKVNFVSDQPTVPRVTGEDYPVYLVGTEAAREGAQDLIRSILAAGVVIRFVIEFPEFLFECRAASCCEDINAADHVGSLTGSGPLVF